MKRICKNCKHFNPNTSVCYWSDRITLEDNWCYSFFKKEKKKKMTFYLVKTYGHVFGSYATEELAQEACAYAQYSEEMSGGSNLYIITKMEVQTETPVVPNNYRKTYCKKRPIREN